jgi:hypothetical protein
LLPGKYKNDGIEGACGPVLIHCDATQTEEKKLEERERQRNGETPTEANVADRFKMGMDLPEVLVRTSKSGSMTQEIFYDYCKHFVASLPDDHQPVILFLDGHASRWNTQALKYLYENKVFVFFFASHTSIWAQPNDCGLNKRVHWAIEQACKQYRRSGRTTTCEYFNGIFSQGWQIFLKAEADDLLECFDNNTTRAFERTGVYPLNPFCTAWTDAIDGLGTANQESKTLSYEIVPSTLDEMPTLSPQEKHLLRTGLDLDDNNDLGDYYIAEIQATKILGKWWGNIEKGVSEGNNAAAYSAIHLPQTFAETDYEKLVMKLVAFELVDVYKIPLPASKTKEERAKDISKTIVDLTPIARPINISYLLTASSTDTDDDSTNNTGTGPHDFSWVDGTAIKRKNNTWNITIANGDELTFTSDKMLTSPKIYVKNAYTELDNSQRKRIISKKRRIRASEQKMKEKEYIELGKVKQKEEEHKEFEKLKARIESGEDYDFSDFQQLLVRMRAPFSCDIDGVNIQVSPDSAAVMFDKAALGAMKKVLVFAGGNKGEQQQDGNEPPKKKRRNTAAAETGLGLGCNNAHFQSDRRDRTQNKKAQETQMKQDLAEKDAIIATLTLFDARKRKYVAALEEWKARRSVGCLRVVPFWVCRESDTDCFRMFLRMFLPRYGWGYLSKSTALQWVAIQENIYSTMDLTENSVNAKEEQLRRRLKTVEQAIQDSSQTVQVDEEPTTMNT